MFPANTLETTLLHVRRGQSPPEALLSALADQPVWVPLPAGGPLPLTTIGGHPYVTVYTSAEQLARAGAGSRRQIRLTGRQLAERLPVDLGFAVNPGSASSLPVTAESIARIRDHRTPADARVLLGIPHPEPYHLLQALAGGFQAVPGVLEARRALRRMDDGPETLMIGIRPDRHVPTWPREVRAAVEQAARLTPIAHDIEIVLLDEQSSTANWMLTRTAPFYARH
ncbi:enhanced serine sensitivity protein SseB C-terminal domain-containing protein [Actinoplanes xinjiangensis]|uniref:enhanced serine sensitivity protein SseB C-terminal domain-containing protein n=1 Tax=Actinoplanes xinjiangensis TaxID=512350 RepID=UPI00344AADF7